MGLLPGSYTPQVQETVVRLGTRMTYGEAQDELALMWQVPISSSAVRHITMRHARVADDLIRQEVERLEQEAPQPTVKPGQIVMSVDGAMIPLTNGEYREVRTMTMGDLRRKWDAKAGRVVAESDNISYFSRLEPAAEFARSALFEWHRRGGERAQKVVTVNDGALWIEGFIDTHCPHAIRVLDWSHAQEALATIGKLIFQPESDAFKRWYARLSHCLLTQPPQRTLADLQFLLHQHQDHAEYAALECAVRYLEKRCDMIDYAHFRRVPIPIGSGPVESGHKVVMQRRMKQAGMRWAEENVNPMLALRTALCNRRWGETWQAIQAHTLEARNMATPTERCRPASTPAANTPVTATDVQHLEQLTQRIERKRRSRRAWQNHDWIFPHRRGRDSSIHKN